MRTRLAVLLAVLLAGVVVLGACADDTGAGDTPPPTATEGAGTETSSGTASEPDLASADLPDGVAARVEDVEITSDDVEQRMALVRQLPQVQEQLQGEGAAQVEAQVESEVLGRLVLQRVVLQGAAEEDIEVSDERVAQDRARLVEDAGGEDGFAEQLGQAGVPEAQLTEELRASIAFELVTEQLLADAEADATVADDDGEAGTELDAPTPGTTPDDRTEQVQQEWLVALVAETDVVVDEQYGAWNPSTGQVVPH